MFKGCLRPTSTRHSKFASEGGSSLRGFGLQVSSQAAVSFDSWWADPRPSAEASAPWAGALGMPWGGVPAALGVNDAQQQQPQQQEALRQRQTAARASAQQAEVQWPVQGRPAPVSPLPHKVNALKTYTTIRCKARDIMTHCDALRHCDV
jgi:hypothetical protein